MMLGHGSYGEVVNRDGIAVKKFSKLTHLIQEYMALLYLSDCKYVVHAVNVNFMENELHMELYDCSLRIWLENNGHRGDMSLVEDIATDVSRYGRSISIIIHDICMGLVELHDRNLAHGDLKPGNILVKVKPLKVVLGDCGFVSISKYAKVDRTAAVYRDPIIDHDVTHDMFSLGVCLLEIIADIKIIKQGTYEELKQTVDTSILDTRYKSLIYNLLHPKKDRRPTARHLLRVLYNEDPPKWIKPTMPEEIVHISNEDIHPDAHHNEDANQEHVPIAHTSSDEIILTLNKEIGSSDPIGRGYIRKLIKGIAYMFKINRSKKSYGALLRYIDTNAIDPQYYRVHIGVTCMITSSVFGESGFNEHQVFKLCNSIYTLEFIYDILNNLLSDEVFINTLLSP